MRSVATGIFAGLIIASMTAGSILGQGRQSNRTVTQADMDRWKKELSNWGRWGPEDQKGTLNLITPAKRKQGAALVRDGVVVSLARDADTVKSAENRFPYEYTMVELEPDSAEDKIAIQFHGGAHTHLDGLGHHFLGGLMYNGFPVKDYISVEKGVMKNSIIQAKEGMFTRGILIDLPRLKGVPYLDPATPIYVEDLEAWEKQAGVKAGSGDAVFIRVGRWARHAKLGPGPSPGLDASVIPWIRQRDIALLGSESALGHRPLPPTTTITNEDDLNPVHSFTMAALGMHLFDNCDLDALAEAAAARKRWEFLLTTAPLPLVTASGSPVNPIAVF